MPQERKQRRQFDLAAGELVQFLGLGGVMRVQEAERAGSVRDFDLWWTDSRVAYVSTKLTTEQVLEALAQEGPVSRPDHIELRTGSSAGGPAFEVTVPGWGQVEAKVWQVEGTLRGLEALEGLVNRQWRQARGAKVEVAAKWVPSEWTRVGHGEEGKSQDPYQGKVRRFAQGGGVMGMVLEEDCGL